MNKQTFQSRIFPIQVRMELPHTVFPTRVQLMWPYKFRSRRTTGSSMCDQDLGHLCRGRCIHTPGHFNYGIVQQSWGVLLFYLGVSRYCVGRLSCTICGSCGARVSATLQVFTPEWFLMAQLVDCGILEMRGMYWVFSLCGRIGLVKKRKCSWRKARERTTMDDTCDTPDDNTYFGAQRWQCNSWAKRISCAVRACEQTVLHKCVLWVGVLSTFLSS